MSGELAALAFIYDCRPDGYKIVRSREITEVFCAEAEQVLERIVKAENAGFAPRPTGLALDSMHALCLDLKQKGLFVTVECCLLYTSICCAWRD